MIDPVRLSSVPATQQVAKPAATKPEENASLRAAAQSFEATFLAEMFSHAGLGQARESNGGGAGEEAFASLLSREWATAVANNGGIGLADRVYEALVLREGSK
ncbi:MAG: rod-binding protein [Pseudomonadota bacterium]